jgi:hypothetical protein
MKNLIFGLMALTTSVSCLADTHQFFETPIEIRRCSQESGYSPKKLCALKYDGPTGPTEMIVDTQGNKELAEELRTMLGGRDVSLAFVVNARVEMRPRPPGRRVPVLVIDSINKNPSKRPRGL